MKRLQAEVEKPKIKGRAHDKKKRMGADKDQGAEAACVQAFRLRALKSPEEVPNGLHLRACPVSCCSVGLTHDGASM